MRFLLPCYAALAFLAAGCDGLEKSGDPTSATPLPQSAPAESKVVADDTMPTAFWSEFQAALKARDAGKVADLTRFPAEIGLAEIDGFEGINEREGFIRHFDAIFPEETVETLLAISASALEVKRPEEAGRTGNHWSISFNHKEPAMSEGEWSVDYTFSQIPDGRVRLTAVGFAG